MVKISIREQLAAAFLLTSLLSLMVLALSIWFQSKNFITNIRLDSLSLTASLKAAQISSALILYEAQVRGLSTRVLVQTALQRFNAGNNTSENWVRAQADIESAVTIGNSLVQAVLYPSFNSNNATELNGLLNVTDPTVLGTIKLPYGNDNGTNVYLGDAGYGYPYPLYPNLTYSAATTNSAAIVSANGHVLDSHGVLVMGPLIVNETFSLLSMTTAVINNTSNQDILGWLSVVVESTLIYDISNSLEGLGSTGEVLVVGPVAPDNHFYPSIHSPAGRAAVQTQDAKFVFPPLSNSSIASRHSSRLYPQDSSAPFPISAFPAVERAWTENTTAINNAGALISTTNEQNYRVSVGYAEVSTPVVDWLVLLEQSYSEVVSPINHLRDVVLICVFAVTGGLLLTVFPLAHYSIGPIRQLKAATSKTVEPYLPDDASGHTGSSSFRHNDDDDSEESEEVKARKEGFLGIITKFRRKPEPKARPTSSTRRRRTFRIPSKVPERKHIVTDELTDLTRTFNEMSDELTMQYERLEERVKERTAQLESSKQAAEAANQSKTLFIANISHELKTPLNGILGLTTVCMNEDDIGKIRSTLNTIYKSGDLLLHLLTDLLTFSKNEVGQQLSIDEAEFRLIDLSTQLIPTFEKQAREGQIDLKVLFFGSNDAFGNAADDVAEKSYGPVGTGRVRDMCLWGDKNRLLQVLMNFVSNSLKFTPQNGSVTVRIKCLGLVEHQPKAIGQRQSSLSSRNSKSSNKKRVRTSENSVIIPSSRDEHNPFLKPNSIQTDNESKLNINVAGGTTQIAKIVQRRRSASPPPLNTKDLMFEFEVEDTGPGIPDEQQKKIFEPFVQGDLGLSKKYGGTGLGLSICVQLAALMGGEISLDSKVGVGSKFTMKLPLRHTAERSASMDSTRRTMSKASSMVGATYDDSEATLRSGAGEEPEARMTEIPRIVGFTQPYVAKEPKQESPEVNLCAMKKAENEAAKAGRKVRVLVAEDNKVNQEVVLRMLKLEEVYDVTIAKDGQEAFERVRESMETGSRFHLVFMDVQMPNVDGIQSTKLIRKMGFSAPIVALTAFAEKSNEDECMASGMDYFLAKPIRRPALKQVLKKYCTTIVEEDSESSTGSASERRATLTDDKIMLDLSDKAVVVEKSVVVNVSDSTDVSPLS